MEGGQGVGLSSAQKLVAAEQGLNPSLFDSKAKFLPLDCDRRWGIKGLCQGGRNNELSHREPRSRPPTPTNLLQSMPHPPGSTLAWMQEPHPRAGAPSGALHAQGLN